MNEREKFLKHIEAARQNGLVALSACFVPSRAMSTEEIYAALNEVEEAVKRGKPHRGWEGNTPSGYLAD